MPRALPLHQYMKGIFSIIRGENNGPMRRVFLEKLLKQIAAAAQFAARIMAQFRRVVEIV